jgi:nitrous oxidase accessory protein NosD
MRKLIRYLGAPVVALAITGSWGVTAASAHSQNSRRSHESTKSSDDWKKKLDNLKKRDDEHKAENGKKSREHDEENNGKHEEKSDRIIVSNGESIQAAIDKAAPGSTIWVREGTYAENVLISKNNIRLLGHDATIVPPSSPGSGGCMDGICVVGPGANFDTGVVGTYIKGTEVRGFTVKGFGNGFFAFGAQDTEVEWNHFIDNHEYGAAAFTSINTEFEHNVSTSDGGEAAFYIGDSPTAHAKLEHNEGSGYTFGIFQRNALGLSAENNELHGNCVGVLVLADAPGPSGDSKYEDNKIHDNSKACPPSDEGGALSGVGVVLAGAVNVRIDDNRITNNTPGGPTDFSGGVVVVKDPSNPASTAPSHNRITDNTVRGNNPDILWDGSGVDNKFDDNRCNTSTPAGLCH